MKNALIEKKSLSDEPIIVSKENDIKNLVYNIRGKQVMLDSDLAKLYQVETKRLNESVKRNEKRFPESFCFQCGAQPRAADRLGALAREYRPVGALHRLRERRILLAQSDGGRARHDARADIALNFPYLLTISSHICDKIKIIL